MEWSEYVARCMGDLDQVQASLLTDIPQSTISRWLSGQRPNVYTAVEFARKMSKGDPIEALLALDIIRPGELSKVVEIRGQVDDLTDAELLESLARRLGVNLRRRGV